MLLKYFGLGLAIAALQGIATAGIGTELVAKGFERPVWAGMPPDGGNDKLWVMEQAGTIWIVDLKTGERAEQPFLKINSRVTRRDNEQGLLGLAFAKDFAKTGRYYLNYSDKDGDTCIARYISKDQLTTDPATEEIILHFDQPYGNHNGGWIGFGPDDMLYIGNGDGGAANDPQGYAQNLESLLGKILRIDVSPKEGYQVPKDNPFVGQEQVRPEIYAYGARNPWRCSFDSKNGDFWMADVGQNHWEEINQVPVADLAGANFGWRPREGMIATPQRGVGGEKPSANFDPIYVYKHGTGSDQGLSVTGGYVYHGPIESLQGRYIFADYQNPRIWSFISNEGRAEDFQDHTDALQPEDGRIALISSFAEANDGNLFILDHTGSLLKIVEK